MFHTNIVEHTRKILTLTQYHCRSLWNWKSGYLSRLIESPAYMVLLGGGLTSIIGVHHCNYIQFMLTGIIILISFRAFTTAIADIANDRKWGILVLFLHSGGNYCGYLLSIYLYFSAIIITQFTITLLISKLIFTHAIHVVPAIFGVIKALLIFPGWVGIAAIIGANVQTYSTRDLILAMISLPVMLSAPILYPLNNAPQYLRIIAHCNPLTYQVAWVRSGTHPVTILLLILWNAIGLSLGYYALKNSPALSREG